MDNPLTKYADLEVRRRDLDNQLKAVEAEMSALKRPALEYMAENQIDKITVNNITFSPKRRLFAAPAEGYTKHDVADALIVAGLGDYVRNDYNANSLSGYVASFDRETDEALTPQDIRERLPEALQTCLVVGEVWNIGATKAGARKSAYVAE